jgi:hypothetical protein
MTDQIDADAVERALREKRIREWSAGPPLPLSARTLKFLEALKAAKPEDPRAREMSRLHGITGTAAMTVLGAPYWAERIRKFMEVAAMSEADLAAKSGLKLDELQRTMETGEFEEERLPRIAAALRMSAASLKGEQPKVRYLYPTNRGG